MKFKFRKLTKREKFAFIPLVGIYWVIRYEFDYLFFYQVMWCFLFGNVVGNFI